jgi:hypothetical protein
MPVLTTDEEIREAGERSEGWRKLFPTVDAIAAEYLVDTDQIK